VLRGEWLNEKVGRKSSLVACYLFEIPFLKSAGEANSKRFIIGKKKEEGGIRLTPQAKGVTGC